MKILQVSSFMPPHPGGLELVVQNLVAGLTERNHRVRWIASATPLAAGREDNLIRVPALSFLEKHMHVPIPFWGIAGHRELYRQCAWADIIHIHDCLYPSSAIASLFAHLLKKPIVLTQHIADVPYGAILTKVQRLAYQTLGKIVLESVDASAAVSAHVPPFFRKMGIKRIPELIRLGFDDRFNAEIRGKRGELRCKYKIEAKSRVILFVGRLVPKKGIAEVVSVQKKLSEKGYILVVVGDGALEPLVRTAPNTLHFRHIPYEKMHEIYGIADLLFLPSRGEGLPLTLQESLLCGLPAVVSNDPSYLINASDAPGVYICNGIDSWTQAICNAFTNPAPTQLISGWAAAHFCRKKFIAQYESIYLKLCQLAN